MQPAFSVIFLTTLIGMGQGLFLAIYTSQVYEVLNVVNELKTDFYIYGSVLSLLLLVAGLLASFFHLGHPERAWRAAAMWRTSWLSREVIMLPVVMFLISMYCLIYYLQWDYVFITVGAVQLNFSFVWGALTALAVLTLFFCTAMIYACLKFLQEWHSPLTVINYILLGTTSGFVLAVLLSFYIQPDKIVFYAAWSVILLILSFIFRVISLYRNRRLRPKSTIQSAIGIRHNKIEQKSMGFMGGSMNTRDFFHGKTQFFIRSIRNIFLILTFVVPLIFTVMQFIRPELNWAIISISSLYLGLIAERWYFFADANHPQNIYYQAIA